MDLIEKWNILKNCKPSIYKPGSVDKIFEINEMNKRDKSGQLPIIIKLEEEEKKEKRKRIIN